MRASPLRIAEDGITVRVSIGQTRSRTHRTASSGSLSRWNQRMVILPPLLPP